MDDDIKKRRMIARSTVSPRLDALADADISAVLISGDQYLVGDMAVLNASVGHWRTLDHSRHGYALSGLIDTIKQAKRLPTPSINDAAIEPIKVSERIEHPPAEPATGRDSVLPEDPDRSLDSHMNAESVAGAATPKLLPGGWP